jgi:hypothetical protein
MSSGATAARVLEQRAADVEVDAVRLARELPQVRPVLDVGPSSRGVRARLAAAPPRLPCALAAARTRLLDGCG